MLFFFENIKENIIWFLGFLFFYFFLIEIINKYLFLIMLFHYFSYYHVSDIDYPFWLLIWCPKFQNWCAISISSNWNFNWFYVKVLLSFLFPNPFRYVQHFAHIVQESYTIIKSYIILKILHNPNSRKFSKFFFDKIGYQSKAFNVNMPKKIYKTLFFALIITENEDLQSKNKD